MELAITSEQWMEWEYKVKDQIQDAFPGLSEDEQEFVLTGIYPGESDYGDDDYDYEDEDDWDIEDHFDDGDENCSGR